jgi:hypothetical protein
MARHVRPVHGGRFIVHGVLLKDDYAATNLMRPEEQQKGDDGLDAPRARVDGGRFHLDLRARRREQAVARPGSSLRLAVALLGCVPLYLIYYVVQPLPGSLVCKQIVFDTICTLILGAAVAIPVPRTGTGLTGYSGRRSPPSSASSPA